jgi:hypothetical protein
MGLLIGDDHDIPTEESNDSPAELAAFFESALSRTLPTSLLDQLMAARREFRERQMYLVGNLETHAISRQGYLEQFNAALTKMMEKNRELLGVSDFIRVYGEAGLNPQGLIDPNVFLGSHQAATS